MKQKRTWTCINIFNSISFHLQIEKREREATKTHHLIGQSTPSLDTDLKWNSLPDLVRSVFRNALSDVDSSCHA